MTARISENVSTWLVAWSIVTIMGNTMPLRDPNDDDDATRRRTATPNRTSSSPRSSGNQTNSPRAEAHGARLATKVFLLSRQAYQEGTTHRLTRRLGTDAVPIADSPVPVAPISGATRSLYARANGYEYDSEKIFCNKDGQVTRVPVRKHVPPDTTACIFWLKNRRPALWRDRHEMDHKVPPRTDKSIAQLRGELLQDMVEAGLVTLLPAEHGRAGIPAGLRDGPGGDRVEAIDRALPVRSGPSRDWIKVKNPDSPAMQRARQGGW